MYCRICGTEKDVKFYATRRQALCPYCVKDTPAKVGRESFDKAYWGKEDVPEAIKREFYSDYLASTEDVKSYIASTCEVAA